MATYQKRGERWFAQVCKRGIRKSKSFDTKTQAKVWATRVEADIEAGASHGHLVSGDSLATLIDRYVAEVKPVKRWGATKDDCLRRLRDDSIGRVRPRNLTAQMVIDYCLRRAKGGAGPSTVALDLTYLNGVLKVARSVWRQDVPLGVITDAREGLKLLGLVGPSKSRDRIATDEELDAIKRHWRSVVPVEVIDFAVDSCMRLGEICRITWDDLDEQVILVRDRKHPTQKEGNHQRVPLLGRCLEILSRLERRDARVFPHPPGTVADAFERARDAAGIKGLRFHDLRHTGTTRLFKQGYRIEEVPVVTGHRDWRMLKRYTHIKAEDVLLRQSALGTARPPEAASDLLG